jgi:hypothetical protein
MKKVIIHLTFVFLIVLLFAPKGYAQQKTLVGLAALASFNIVDSKYSQYYDPRFGYGVEVNAMHFFGRNIFLTTGFSYLRKGYTMNGIPDTRFLFAGDGTIDYNNIKYSTQTVNFNYLSLPLSVGFGLLNKKDSKFSLFVMGGLQLNYMFREKVNTHLVDGNYSAVQSSNDAGKNFSSAVTTGFMLLYAVSDRMNIMLKPAYSYDFYQANDANPKLHSISISAGVQFQLKK